jgi:hypothetical protein
MSILSSEPIISLSQARVTPCILAIALPDNAWVRGGLLRFLQGMRSFSPAFSSVVFAESVLPLVQAGFKHLMMRGGDVLGMPVARRIEVHGPRQACGAVGALIRRWR